MRMTHLLRVACPFLFGALCFACVAMAQTETATVSGLITDGTGAVVPGAEVKLQSVERGTIATATTNDVGIYVFASVHPGQYQVTVHKAGFKQVDLLGVIVNVQDHIEQNFRLQVGSVAESVTVNANDLHINTTDGSVSTVVDRQFAGNLPLNGRSFSTLLQLTPGIVLTRATEDNGGQFSVNGQRPNSNYFMVDGVGANIGIANSSGLQQSGGSLPGLSVLGGTSNLVSVDALQEFRVVTSTFAPEYGRMPGAEISISTRSGTNQFHGSVFDYFRNDVLDANDWFANHNGLPKPKERQNDFGGVLGGPIWKNRTFFFFSYEGLRLRQPLTAITDVPSLTTRQNAVPSIRPLLNAFPIPNGPDRGNGMAQFAATYSNPSSLDATSIRVDHTFSSRVNMFGRYNHAPSELLQRRGPFVRSLSTLGKSKISTDTVTGGATWVITPRITNDLRLNYSRTGASLYHSLDNFGGAQPPPSTLLFPLPAFSTAEAAELVLSCFSCGTGVQIAAGKDQNNSQGQVNIVNSLSIVSGAHQIKVGADYRRLSPTLNVRQYLQTGNFSAVSQLVTGSPASTSVRQTAPDATLLFDNLSLYAQDAWKASSRLTLTYGLRWEWNPAPRLGSRKDGLRLFPVNQVSNPSQIALVSPGTALYETRYNNFAPRLGVAYLLSQREGRQTVLRGGIGMFYDIGNAQTGNTVGGYPFIARKVLANVPFPLDPSIAAPPALSNATPIPSFVQLIDPKLELPRVYQWNVAVEQPLGQNQTASVSYVGAIGRRLINTTQQAPVNPLFTASAFPAFVSNGATSDYHALQLQFQRRLTRGLQTLASYTWSHSIDTASFDNIIYVGGRAPSAFDVRHAASAAVTYSLPQSAGRSWADRLWRDWALDMVFRARSAAPVDLSAGFVFIGGELFSVRPDVVPGVPFYISDPTLPGGRRINRAAFAVPPAGRQGTLGRNALRGFPVSQADLGVRRQFGLTERVKLELKLEAFNIFNHPNFGAPNQVEGNNTLSNPSFGISQQSFGSTLSSGGTGVNPLYEIGGPRSMQLEAKIRF